MNLKKRPTKKGLLAIDMALDVDRVAEQAASYAYDENNSRVFMSGGLVAEVWRRPEAPRAASYVRCGSSWVALLFSRGRASLRAAVPIEVDWNYRYMWVVRRQDGSLFERRRILAFKWSSGDNYTARYDLFLLSLEMLLHHIENSVRDPVTLEWLPKESQ